MYVYKFVIYSDIVSGICIQCLEILAVDDKNMSNLETKRSLTKQNPFLTGYKGPVWRV